MKRRLVNELACLAFIVIIQPSLISAQNIVIENFPMTWRKEAGTRIDALPYSILAPDIQKLDDGSYRAYYTVTGEGVGSAVSEDGLTWIVEDGFRMISLRNDPDYQEGTVGWDLGHPWLVRLNNGNWRMYMQANSGINTPLRIISAMSTDGVVFSLEDGLRMNIGENSGPPALSFAGHGRAMLREDGLWIMAFSGNLLDDKNPSDIMLATSADGLIWHVIDSCIANNGHDPTLLQLSDESWAMVFAYLKESLQVCFSEDGLIWSMPKTLQLLEEDESPMADVHGDVALMWRPDGGLRLMSNEMGGVIISFVPVVTNAVQQHCLPGTFILNQNFPNPFNPCTTIFWTQNQSAVIEIQIVNTKGQLIRNLFNGFRMGGNHSIIWDGQDNQGNHLPSGIYMVRLIFEGLSIQSKKIMLVR